MIECKNKTLGLMLP